MLSPAADQAAPTARTPLHSADKLRVMSAESYGSSSDRERRVPPMDALAFDAPGDGRVESPRSRSSPRRLVHAVAAGLSRFTMRSPLPRIPDEWEPPPTPVLTGYPRESLIDVDAAGPGSTLLSHAPQADTRYQLAKRVSRVLLYVTYSLLVAITGAPAAAADWWRKCGWRRPTARASSQRNVRPRPHLPTRSHAGVILWLLITEGAEVQVRACLCRLARLSPPHTPLVADVRHRAHDGASSPTVSRCGRGRRRLSSSTSRCHCRCTTSTGTWRTTFGRSCSGTTSGACGWSPSTRYSRGSRFDSRRIRCTLRCGRQRSRAPN